MIGKLKGIIDSIDDGIAVMDVGGVGYNVLCSERTLSRLTPGEAAELVIETQVREDHIHLFGFLTTGERAWFRLLSTVQRVGAKVALAILSAHTPEQLAHAIAAKDVTAFSRISGIGGKLAERIVTELKDQAAKMPLDGTVIPGHAGTATGKKTVLPAKPVSNALEDTISALTHMGYSRSEAYGAAMRVAQEAGDAQVDEMIRKTLKELAS